MCVCGHWNSNISLCLKKIHALNFILNHSAALVKQKDVEDDCKDVDDHAQDGREVDQVGSHHEGDIDEVANPWNETQRMDVRHKPGKTIPYIFFLGIQIS